MRKSVVVIVNLPFLIASCTQKRVVRNSSTVRSTAPFVSTTAIAQRTTSRVIESTKPQPTLSRPRSVAPCAQASSPTEEAGNFVTALISGELQQRPENALWAQVLGGGSIISTEMIEEAAGRAIVAVSLAFDRPTDKAVTDPIGLRLQLAEVNGCWHVESVGYL
jgi:hypothetical protein